MLKAGKLELLKWNERDLLRQIEREKAKRQDGLTEYYIKKFTEMLEDIRKQIVEEEKKAQ